MAGTVGAREAGTEVLERWGEIISGSSPRCLGEHLVCPHDADSIPTRCDALSAMPPKQERSGLLRRAPSVWPRTSAGRSAVAGGDQSWTRTSKPEKASCVVPKGLATEMSLAIKQEPRVALSFPGTRMVGALGWSVWQM